MLCCSVENRVIGGVTEAPDGRSEEALIEVLLIRVSFVLFLGGLNCRKGLVLETQLAGQMTVVALRANGLGVDCCALLVSLSSTAAATSSNSTISSSTAWSFPERRESTMSCWRTTLCCNDWRSYRSLRPACPEIYWTWTGLLHGCRCR